MKALNILLTISMLCVVGLNAQSIEPIGNGYFKIDRLFAEKIAMQKDSLLQVKIILQDTESTLEACKIAANDANVTAKLQSSKLKELEKQSALYIAQIESKDRQILGLEQTNRQISEYCQAEQKRLKRRKNNTIFVGVFGGLAAGLVTGLMIIR